MTSDELTELEANVMFHMPGYRSNIADLCSSEIDHISAVNLTIDRLMTRGLVIMDESGMLRRAVE